MARAMSRAKIRRIIAKEVESLQRDIRLTQGLTSLIEVTTTLQAGTSLSLAGPLEIKSINPARDAAIQLILEPTAVLSITG